MSNIKNQALYLTEDVIRSLSDGQYPLVTQAGPSMVKEIRGRLNQRVEEIIANDRNNVRLDNFERVCHLKSGKDYRFQLLIYDSPQQV